MHSTVSSHESDRYAFFASQSTDRREELREALTQRSEMAALALRDRREQDKMSSGRILSIVWNVGQSPHKHQLPDLSPSLLERTFNGHS